MRSDLAFRVAKRVGLRVRDLLGHGPRGEWAFAIALALLSPREPTVPLEVRAKLRWIRRGFLPLSYVLYGLDAHDPSAYLSDRRREDTQGINGPSVALLGDKIAFYLMLVRFGAPTAAVEAILAGGRLHPLSPNGSGSWLRDRLRSDVPLVLKPAQGGGGGGVLVLRGTSEGPTVNGEPVSWTELEARLARLDDHVATTFVRQAGYAARIQPGSTNTVRLLTMINERGRAFLAGAVHRFGSARSMPVDNWTQGGLSVDIDLETGRLGGAARFPHDGELSWTTHHPDTGARTEGVVIPGWREVREGVLALADQLPFLPYVGWDVVVTDDGYVILEGNQYTGVHMFQVHRPLLEDPRVRGFYRRHGVVR